MGWKDIIQVRLNLPLVRPELCKACAEPILAYLAEKKLLDKLPLDYMQTDSKEVS